MFAVEFSEIKKVFACLTAMTVYVPASAVSCENTFSLRDKSRLIITYISVSSAFGNQGFALQLQPQSSANITMKGSGKAQISVKFINQKIVGASIDDFCSANTIIVLEDRMFVQ